MIGQGMGRNGAATVAALVAAVCTLTCQTEAQAQRATFGRPTVFVSVASGLHALTGQVGQDAGEGLGLEVAQALQYRYVGFNLSLGSVFFLTHQQPPPSAKGLEAYILRVGPRLIVPVRGLRVVADAEYVRLGVISNALVRDTGTSLEFNSVGGSVHAQWLLSRGVVGLRLSYAEFIELNGGMMSLSLELGALGSL